MHVAKSIVRTTTAILVVGAVSLIAAACADSGRVVEPKVAAPRTTGEIFDGTVKVCKWSETAGTFTFNLSRTGGGEGVWIPDQSTGPTSQLTITVPANSDVCKDIFAPTNESSWTGNTSITVSEVMPSGMVVSAIDVYKNNALVQYLTGPGTQSATETAGFSTALAFEFQNIGTPPGSQGCTPGYWKNIKMHGFAWVPTGYTTGQKLSTVFTIPGSYVLNNKWMGNYSMLNGLSFQGGSTLSGAAQILLRAGVAAVLNANQPNVDYSYSDAEVKSMVNSALASNDRQTIITTAGMLDYSNNAGCNLGNGK